jgi:phospholipid/cholesterol/gamma-HCH transport system substrate-binding protein
LRQNTGGRILAVVALVAAAAVALAVFFLGRDEPYRVKATFVNASQLVPGNEVRVAGAKVGSVEEIKLTDDTQAEITFTVSDDYAPLREGTRAAVRLQSLSGIANRYVDLQLGDARGGRIDDGGRITTFSTDSPVDVDQFFNIFDPETRKNTQRTIKLFGEFNAGREEEAQAALRYLSPSLAASSRLFDELSANDTQLERFITETAGLVTDLAARDDDLAGLVSNLSVTMNALASQRAELGDAISVLPSFLRRGNTTFVNLRAALDDLDPLVDASRPVVRQLPGLFAQLRPFARSAVPTVRDLSRTIRRPGENNDLVELLRAQPAVDRIANDTAERNGRQRPGAFPETIRALEGATPQIAFLKPYAPDLAGWFDDFSASGGYDALGAFSRAGLQLNAFTFTPLAGLVPVPPELRDEAFAANVKTGRNNRCPGSVERPAPDGTNPYLPTPGFNCDPTQVPFG